jgi:hypothetical protein
MRRCLRNRIKRTLLGLWVLGVLMLSLAQANAVVLIAHATAGQPTTAEHADHHSLGASTSDHDHSDAPCKGHERSHGMTCCLLGNCPLLSGDVPRVAPIVPPVAISGSRYLTVAAAAVLEFGLIPALPPPR